MDGWLRIGTKLDNSKFEVQVKALENQIEELEEKSQPLVESMQEYRDALQTIGEEIKRVNEEHLTTEQIMERINGLASEGFDFTGDFEKLRETMSDEEAYLKVIEFIQQSLTAELKSQYSSYKKINNQIELNKTKIESLKQSHINFGKEGTKAFKSLTKGAKSLLLGLVGIHSAYSILSKLIHAALQNNEQLGNQIESIWTGLGSMLEPVIKVIVELFKKAATAVLYFIGLLTHQNLIEKANAAILRNREKELKKQTKATNELNKANQKFTASFDELNMVQEQSTKSQNTIEPLDKSLLFNVKDLSDSTIKFLNGLNEKLRPIKQIIKDIIDWCKEHPDMLIKILGGVALLTLLGKIVGVTGVSGLIYILELLMLIAAVKFAWDGLEELNETIKEFNNQLDESYKKTAEKTRATQDEQEAIRKNAQSYKKNSKELKNLTKELNKNIDAEQGFQKAQYETLTSASTKELVFMKLNGEYDKMLNNIISSIQREGEYLQTQKKLYEQGKLNEDQIFEYNLRLTAFNKRLEEVKTTNDKLPKGFKLSADQLAILDNETQKTSQAMYDAGLKSSAFTNIVKNETKAVDNLTDSMEKVPLELDTEIDVNAEEVKNEVDKMMKHIKQATGTTNKVKITPEVQQVQKAVDNLMKDIKTITQSTHKVKFTFTSNVGESIFKEWNKATELIIALGGKPKNAATGGIHIVNNPGRGVMSGNVRYGEAGSEGILPLTDASAMERLGQEIGKNIVLNATLINKINGRTLSKEVQQILAESGFYANS